MRTTVELLKLHRKMDMLIARMSRFEQRAEPVISNAVDEANDKAG